MKIVIATNNMGKLKEFQRILGPIGYEVLSQSQAGADIEVEETGDTFEANAYLKAKAVFDICKITTMADDSGLMVDALGGQPGVHTARYAGEGKNHDDNINLLLSNLKDVEDEKRTGKFVSAISLITPEKEYMIRGECQGKIGFEKTGEDGFGYDPIFMVGDKSFAQMTAEEKDSVSHRGKAVREAVEILKEYIKGGK